VIYVVGSEGKAASRTKLTGYCKHNLNVVAIGNGTACRQIEQLVAEIIAADFMTRTFAMSSTRRGRVFIPRARSAEKNFQSATPSGCISIGRRLQDPLSGW
jgi:uncharacterized protein